jgi:hypothetical protein
VHSQLPRFKYRNCIPVRFYRIGANNKHVAILVNPECEAGAGAKIVAEAKLSSFSSRCFKERWVTMVWQVRRETAAMVSYGFMLLWDMDSHPIPYPYPYIYIYTRNAWALPRLAA